MWGKHVSIEVNMNGDSIAEIKEAANKSKEGEVLRHDKVDYGTARKIIQHLQGIVKQIVKTYVLPEY